MNKEKQIDMITELLIDFDEMGFAPTTLCPDPEAYAIEWRENLTEELKGYRKAAEVAREIFAEIEEVLNMQAIIVCQTRQTVMKADVPPLSYMAMLDGRIYSLRVVEEHIAELKKKYTCEKHRCYDCKHCTSVDESACEACIDGSRWESEDAE